MLPARQVLLDTGPLYALLYERDRKHDLTVEVLAELEAADTEVLCAYPAALEAHKLALNRGRFTVDHVHDLIVEALEVFETTMPTPEDRADALQNLKRYRDQKITLTDATIAAMAKRAGMTVLTFDQDQRHFQLLGAAVYGGDEL